MAPDPIASDTRGFRRDVDSVYIEGELIKNNHQKKGVSLIIFQVMSVGWVSVVAFRFQMNYSAEYCGEC